MLNRLNVKTLNLTLRHIWTSTFLLCFMFWFSRCHISPQSWSVALFNKCVFFFRWFLFCSAGHLKCVFFSIYPRLILFFFTFSSVVKYRKESSLLYFTELYIILQQIYWMFVWVAWYFFTRQVFYVQFLFTSPLPQTLSRVVSSGCVSIRNFTIRFMPIPIIDASQALKASPEKTEDALLKVGKKLTQGFLKSPSWCVV